MAIFFSLLTQTASQQRTLASLAALALAAVLPLATASFSQPANEGIPPDFAGLWAEEREGVDGGPSMLLSRQWLPDGNGFVLSTQVGACAGGDWRLRGRSDGLEMGLGLGAGMWQQT